MKFRHEPLTTTHSDYLKNEMYSSKPTPLSKKANEFYFFPKQQINNNNNNNYENMRN